MTFVREEAQDSAETARTMRREREGVRGGKRREKAVAGEIKKGKACVVLQ